MDIIYLFRVLLKRKWIIIGAALVAAGLTYFLTRHENKYYRSYSQFSTGFAVSDEIPLNNNNVSLFEAETKFNNVIVTMMSPSVTSLLSYLLILHDLENPAKVWRTLTEEEKKSPAYTSVNIEQAKKIFKDKLETMTMLSPYKPEEKKLLDFLALYNYDSRSIAKNLVLYRVQRTDYIQIDYVSLHPELSAFAVNNLFQQFLRYYRGVRSDRSQESIDTLRSLMEKKKEELETKNETLKQNGIFLDAGDVNTGTMSTIGEMELQLTDERNKLTGFEYELKKIDQRLANLKNSPSNNPTLVDNEEIILAQNAYKNAYKTWSDNPTSDNWNRYQKLLEDYKNKRKKYQSSDDNITVRPTESREDLLSKRGDIQIDIQATKKNIAQIQGKINQLQGSVNTMSSKSAEVQTMLKERDQANKDYLEAKQRYTDALDYGTSAINNFRQVVPGLPASEPEPSKRKMLVGMAGAGAAVITILIIILLTYLDTSIKTPVIFNKSVGLKMISMVNFMNLKTKKLSEIIANKDGALNAADKNRNNIFRESLRKLRYEIESSGKKIFLFTSTKKGQGKTTLIQALSYSMSLSKKKILIIDTNFCNNDLTVQLDADPILEKITPHKNGQTLLDQVRKVSKDVGAGLVYAIGSEGGDYTPSEILPKQNLLQHLQSLTEEFDYIFLEGPPLNDFSDSKELAQYVEGVIAVFSATDAIKQIDKQSISFFKELNGKFCGSILNMVDLKNVNVS